MSKEFTPSEEQIAQVLEKYSPRHMATSYLVARNSESAAWDAYRSLVRALGLWELMCECDAMDLTTQLKKVTALSRLIANAADRHPRALRIIRGDDD